MRDIQAPRSPTPAPPKQPEQEPITEPAPPTPTTPPEPPHNRSTSWWHRHWKWAVPAIALIVLGSGGALAWHFRPQSAPVAVKATPKPTPIPTPTPTPATRASALTGLQVPNEVAGRPVTGVVIENQTDSRPQSGLSQAGVVYEALAEGGITRFVAFFLDNKPTIIGPVRSLRTYFLSWGLEFDAPIAHAGGNADALDLVAPLGLKDLNALTTASNAFYRTSDRQAPHNLYTSSDALDQLLLRLNYNKPTALVPSPRKDDSPGTGGAPHPNIHINYSYNGYQVDYQYAAATNDYLRLLAGKPHIDRNTNQPIRVKNMVLEYMPTTNGTTRIGEQTVVMQTVGTGRAVVFRDGVAIEGTWSKASHSARTKLLDATGKDIPLNAGNTWYSIVPDNIPKAVSY